MNQQIRQFGKRIFFSHPVFWAYSQLSWQRFRGKIIRRHGNLRLHIGCGNRILEGWINIDVYPGLQILTLRLPKGLRKFPDNSAQHIYAAHFLEHLDYPDEATEFVRHCYRILQSGGVFRVIVPGIENIIQAYIRNDQEFFAVQSAIHPSWCTTRMEHLLYALQQEGEHKFGYDIETMTKLLSDTGFSQVKEQECHQTRIDGLRDYRAITDHRGKPLSLYVEASKP